MAEWHSVDLVFEETPSADALAAANAWLRDADYDAPPLTADGWREKSWRSPLVKLDELVHRLSLFGLVLRARSMEQRPAWGNDVSYLDTLAAQPWFFSPRSKPLTMAEAAAKFDEMGGAWTGKQVAAALRAMCGKQ